jgi:hypothetical protein
MLNFGAVYYELEIWIDGKFVGRHFGGSDSVHVLTLVHVRWNVLSTLLYRILHVLTVNSLQLNLLTDN